MSKLQKMTPIMPCDYWASRTEATIKFKGQYSEWPNIRRIWVYIAYFPASYLWTGKKTIIWPFWNKTLLDEPQFGGQTAYIFIVKYMLCKHACMQRRRYKDCNYQEALAHQDFHKSHHRNDCNFLITNHKSVQATLY